MEGRLLAAAETADKAADETYLQISTKEGIVLNNVHH